MCALRYSEVMRTTALFSDPQVVYEYLATQLFSIQDQRNALANKQTDNENSAEILAASRQDQALAMEEAFIQKEMQVASTLMEEEQKLKNDPKHQPSPALFGMLAFA